MAFLLAALTIMVATGALAIAGRRLPRFASIIGAGGCVAGCGFGLAAVVRLFVTGANETLHSPWSMPLGSYSLGLDPLSAFFLIPILGLAALSAIYGAEYLRHPWRPRSGASWLWYNLLIASMVLLVLARNGLLFLLAWEMMSLASFFLVVHENEKATARGAGWTYLVATHLGTAFLLAMFCLLGREAGSLEFAGFRGLALSPTLAGMLFAFGVIGFGTKAGFLPLHVWLPEAHPAAPSHVSAVMSGVMIKTGIYGLIRLLTWLGPGSAWQGWLLIAIGLSSGILGVLFALAQHDLKRLLAYHSVENIGIIALGLGLGRLGASTGATGLMVLGYAGALLHVLNHAIFKGLLFLGAGSVLHATGTGELDRLGGLLKRMPWTAFTFLIGAVAISGLPPLNGFVSEFLIYLASLREGVPMTARVAVPALSVIAGLALIGGLAAACFAKAFGVVFLGEPRGEEFTHAHECGLAMRWPMVVLAAACVGIGLGAPLIVTRLTPIVADVTDAPVAAVAGVLAPAGQTMMWFIGAALIFAALVAFLALLRRGLLAGRTVGKAGTWDCGYARPTARMQYTASSFAQPLTDLFRVFLRTHKKSTPPVGLFPARGAFHSETPDACREGLFRPLFAGFARLVEQLRGLQHGHIHVYVLYIILVLILLLIVKL